MLHHNSYFCQHFLLGLLSLWTNQSSICSLLLLLLLLLLLHVQAQQAIDQCKDKKYNLPFEPIHPMNLECSQASWTRLGRAVRHTAQAVVGCIIVGLVDFFSPTPNTWPRNKETSNQKIRYHRTTRRRWEAKPVAVVCIFTLYCELGGGGGGWMNPRWGIVRVLCENRLVVNRLG